MDLTISVRDEVRFRLPLRDALEWMSAALAANGNDAGAAHAALCKALDAYQRAVT